ncbi:hypothetical protein [Salinimicrobium flavum]|uniref:CarboxypepD_reg-like domain-containing protein n=1 Tax=Salinimicrobium flavum TaxID=1737065 RepID=A0ABW5ITW9_9FLAO
MKNLLLLFLIFFCGNLTAQTFGRAEIKGNIKVSAESDPEGITIFNKNSGRGTISSEKGIFSIYAQAGDSLYFSALQFKALLVIVDPSVIDSGYLNVEILDGINELPEVVVREHDLTGRLETDAKIIHTVDVPLPSWSAADINDFDWEFPSDAQSGVSNPAMNRGGSGIPGMGFNPIAIVGGLVGLIAPPRSPKKEPERPVGIIFFQREIRSRYNDQFFREVFQIPKEEIHLFLEFTHAGSFSPSLLEKNRELDLLQFLVDQSEKFREAAEEI